MKMRGNKGKGGKDVCVLDRMTCARSNMFFYREDDIKFSIEIHLSEGNTSHSSDVERGFSNPRAFFHSFIQQILIIYVLSVCNLLVGCFFFVFTVDNPLPFETTLPAKTFPSLAFWFFSDYSGPPSPPSVGHHGSVFFFFFKFMYLFILGCAGFSWLQGAGGCSFVL